MIAATCGASHPIVAPAKRRTDRDLGKLIFKCPVTGEKFDSGFQSTRAELANMPADGQMTLRCPICRENHIFKVIEGEIAGPD